MMARLDPSIRHAITPPDFGENMLHREHLVDRLHGEIPRKLVAIAAPAGYGKTTILADFVAHAEMPICWVSLTEADRDMMRLATVLLASLERRFRRLRDQMDLRAYLEESPANVAASIVSLIEQNVPESFVIILDDVHHIHASEDSIEFVDGLIIDLPEQTTVIAAGREVLEVSLARLMAQGDLAGLGSHDLAYRFEEVKEILNDAEGGNYPERRVSEIYERTRGWPAAVNLAYQTSSQSSLVGDIPESLVYEYLGSVVLNRQPERLRRFLIEASILPVMTAEILDQVLDRDDSGDLLSAAHARSLFLTVSGGDQETYEFHPIFRSLLRDTLKASSPSRFIELHETAANYLGDVSPETAVSLSLETGNLEKAAEVIEKIAERFFSAGRFATLIGWFELFEKPTLEVPNLTYYCAKILSTRGESEEAFELWGVLAESPDVSRDVALRALASRGMMAIRLGWHDEAEAIIADLLPELDKVAVPDIRAMTYRLEARFKATVEKEFDFAANLIDKAIDELEAVDDHYELLDSLQEKVQILGLGGDMLAARNTSHQVIKLSQTAGSDLTNSRAVNNLAQLEYLAGNYEEALNAYEEAKASARRASSRYTEAWILLGQADIFNDIGLAVQAADLYGQVLRIATSIDNLPLIRLGCLRTSILHRRGASYRIAREWIRRASEVETSMASSSLVIEQAALSMKADPGNAKQMLVDLLDSDERLEADGEVLAQFFLASASYLVDDRGASEIMHQCFEMASLKGWEQVVAAELSFMSEIEGWATRVFAGQSSFSIIQSRIEAMRSYRGHYGPQDDAPDERSDLRICSLGGGRIYLQGKPVDGLKPQAVQLLIYLIDRGSAERDRLAEEFWTDFPPGRQTANLHMAVYSLRRKLGKEAIQLEGSVYRINPELDLRYDAVEFERAVDVALRLPPGDPRKLFALGESIRHYEGMYLPEFFSDWVQEKRRLLEHKYLDVVSDYADEAIRRDQPDKAVPTLREALTADPLRDDLNELYVEALGMMRRRSELVAHYERYKDLLSEELGLEPSRSLKELYRKFIKRA